VNILKQAFRLLDGFASLQPGEQRSRLAKLERLLVLAEAKEQASALALREIDQLRKQRAYLLIASGQIPDGIKAIESMVGHYEDSIARLHDEAAFQLAEAAVAAFKSGRTGMGVRFATSALKHSGNAGCINKTVLSALALVQQHQERLSRKAAKRK